MFAMNPSSRSPWRIAAATLATSLCLCASAQAALGRAPQPHPADAVEPTPAARQLRAMPLSDAYTVSTIVEPSGTVVREFVNAQQQVFAVVWAGPVLPDLAVFFGDYFIAYQQTVQQRRAAGQRGGVLYARRADLVMLSRGRMGNFEGHAYVPALVPTGVHITTLLP